MCVCVLAVHVHIQNYTHIVCVRSNASSTQSKPTTAVRRERGRRKQSELEGRETVTLYINDIVIKIMIMMREWAQ